MNNYKSSIPLMRHQIAARLHFNQRPKKEPDVAALLMETGTGKTKVILEEFQEGINSGELNAMLVIAPAGSIKNWYMDKSDEQPAEIKAHLDPELFRRLHVAAWPKVKATPAGRPCAMFINVEAFSSSTRVAENLAIDFMSKSNCLLVMDESTRIRRKSLRTKAVLRIKHYAKRRRILTGFVTPKSPLDLYHQYEFLDNNIIGYPTYTAFRARYAIIDRICIEPTEKVRSVLTTHCGLRMSEKFTDDKLKRNLKLMLSSNEQIKLVDTLSRSQTLFGIERIVKKARRDEMLEYLERILGFIPHSVKTVPKIKDFRYLDELQAKIKPYTFQILKSECLDLKPKIYEPRDVELTKMQKEIYRDLLAEAHAELDSHHVTATTVMAQIQKLHQVVCGHVRDEHGEVLDIESNRVDDLLEILAEHSGKAIIWTCYDPEIRKITAALQKEYGTEGVAAYWGGNKSTRDVEEKKFLSHPDCRFMVSTQASGGMGNTWNVATLTVYAGNSYDLEHRFQSEDRNHRKGQNNSVTYIDMIARGTVEERILYALRNKIDLATKITGENYRKWLI
jgi:hypothetical protein